MDCVSDTRPDNLQILWSCKECGIVEATARVEYRSANEELNHFYYRALTEAAWIHTIVAPLCSTDGLLLFIPHTHPDGLGFKPPQSL